VNQPSTRNRITQLSATQRAEAIGTPSTPEARLPAPRRGTRLTLPRAEDFPLNAREAEEDDKHLTALTLILGADQYTTWRRLTTTAAHAEEFPRS